jgi:hypothetical protein
MQEEDILRDLFAAAVAAGAIARESAAASRGQSISPGKIAEFAYTVSDAMLGARRKPATSAKKR